MCNWVRGASVLIALVARPACFFYRFDFGFRPTPLLVVFLLVLPKAFYVLLGPNANANATDFLFVRRQARLGPHPSMKGLPPDLQHFSYLDCGKTIHKLHTCTIFGFPCKLPGESLLARKRMTDLYQGDYLVGRREHVGKISSTRNKARGSTAQRALIPGLVNNNDAAPPQLRPLEAKYLNTRIDLLKSNSQFKTSIQAIQLLRHLNVIKESSLDHLFCIAAIFIVVTKRPPRELMEDLWAMGTGKTWKALSEFPARLRKMAHEVKQVHAGHFFNVESSIPGQTPLANAIKQRIHNLPTDLGATATQIEFMTKKLPIFFNNEDSRTRKFHEPWFSWLCEFIRTLTGKYRDREVAELLNSAAYAMKETFEVEVLAITQARSNRKSKSRT